MYTLATTRKQPADLNAADPAKVVANLTDFTKCRRRGARFCSRALQCCRPYACCSRRWYAQADLTE